MPTGVLVIMYTYLKTIKILRRRPLTPQVRDHQSVVGRAFALQEGVVHVWWWYALCTQPSNLCFWEKLKPPLRHGLYLPAEPRLHQKPVLANLWLPELLALLHSYVGLCRLIFFLRSRGTQKDTTKIYSDTSLMKGLGDKVSQFKMLMLSTCTTVL
jgi:hypothetical protein